MRLANRIIFIGFVTIMALAYVHQQVELVKLSYAIQSKEKKLKEILDRRAGLEYNIDNLETPSRLEQILMAKNIDLSFPKRENVVKVRKTKSDGGISMMALERKTNVGFLEFFSLKAEAQAREK